MVHLTLENVFIDFPVYDQTTRSFRRTVFHDGVAGRFTSDDGKRQVVSALRNVSLNLREGDRLGLIGGNGGGKTTLLRVMAGIYEPTYGVRSSLGQIVPLLGGSLGMDLDLPGLDNIFLRGRVLGLSRKQIKAKIDDIVEFTELERFLHLPVRTYSAGMRVRLAFAITTAVDADILLLDEGIGAGDASFRQKANDRLNRFIERAGVLVLATHSDSLMSRFCDKAMWLNHGEAKGPGPLEEMQAQYRASIAHEPKPRAINPEKVAHAIAAKRESYERAMAEKQMARERAAAEKQRLYAEAAAGKQGAYQAAVAAKQAASERKQAALAARRRENALAEKLDDSE